MDMMTASILQLALENGVLDTMSASDDQFCTARDCETWGLINISYTDGDTMQLSATKKGRELYAEAMQMYNPRPDIS